jgi:hypothetical protein
VTQLYRVIGTRISLPLERERERELKNMKKVKKKTNNKLLLTIQILDATNYYYHR